MGDTVILTGETFDLSRVPDSARVLRLHTVRKAHLGKLAGLQDLPLRELELRWISAPDLEALPLPACLQTLKIWHSPKLRSLRGVERATALRTLVWTDTGTLEDAMPLAQVPEFRELRIEGGPGSSQKTADLAFLADLRLESLTLRGIAGASLDLSPVAALAEGTRIEIHGPSFKPEELAKVAAAHPPVLDDLMALRDYPPSLGLACKTCGGIRKELFLRGKKGLWCPVCEAKGLTAQLNAFRTLVEAARA
ncbi:MAG: hypothetical protein AAF913_17195 [Pseudomonadota bacterium]